MKVLELNQKILRLLGLCLEHNATQRELYLSAFANVCILAINLVLIEFSGMFFYNSSDRMGKATFSILQIVASVEKTGTYVSYMLNKNAICACFDKLQELVNESV